MDVSRFAGHDGAELAYRETGSGRPLILLHGFMGVGSHWLDQGPVGMLAEQGFRLVLPDFRGHGKSMRSHDPLAYPPDVLADDGLVATPEDDLRRITTPTLVVIGDRDERSDAGELAATTSAAAATNHRAHAPWTRSGSE
jgi:pimeloyl-ACP methyl ester carboxylesterase